MSATEEVANTRVTPVIFRKCRECKRPWELKSQLNHKCCYCGASEFEKEKKGGDWDLLWGFIVILVWVALGFIIVYQQEITTWITQWIK